MVYSYRRKEKTTMKYKYWYYHLTGQRARLARIMDAIGWKFTFSEDNQRIGINAYGINAVIWMNSYPSEKEGFKFCYGIVGDGCWYYDNSLLNILAIIDYRLKLKGKQKKCKLLGSHNIITTATINDYINARK